MDMIELTKKFGYGYVHVTNDPGILIAGRKAKTGKEEWFHIDRNGNPLYNERYDLVTTFRNGIAVVTLDNKSFFINKQGKPISDEKYDDAWLFYDDAAVVKQDGRLFHVDKQCKPLYEQQYDDVSSFDDGIASVVLDGKQFHIDKQGNPLYKERYDWVEGYEQGVSRVRSNDTILYIDMKGNPIPEESISRIGSRLDTLHILHPNENEVIFKTGCFSGNLHDFELAVLAKHEPGSKPYNEYMEVIERYNQNE